MNGFADDMWAPFKHLYRVIEQTVVFPTEEAISNLEVVLKRHKQIFVNLLRCPPKNETNRAQLRAFITQGVQLTGKQPSSPLSKDLVDETLVISDMFDLDEFLALELLCTAQHQMAHYPGLPRGLVAVLLYYDGRKAVSNCIRDLFQIVNGVSWVPESPQKLVSLITSYAQELVCDANILERIIELLDELDLAKEIELLTKNRALGNVKHQNQVIEIFEDIRMSLATALFNWSAQRGLSKTVTIKLLRAVSMMKSKEANGKMENTAVALLMALLYAYDTSILQKQDNNRLIQGLSIIKDFEYVQQVHNYLSNLTNLETNEGIISIVKFSFGLSIAGLRHASNYLQNYSTVTEYDEQLVDDAICTNVFNFIYCNLLEKNLVYQHQFFYRRIHMLFTDFIDFMHSKVTELRGKADETSKTVVSFTNEGLEPPANLDHNFEMLLLCIGKLYANNPANLSLCSEYWGPLEASANTTARSVSLFKFIRLAGELLPATLFVPYLKMIAGLSSCERSARSTFNLLKQSTGLTGSVALSWEHFFSSLSRYYANLKQDYYPGSDSIYRNRLTNRNINPREIEGLRAVLEVLRSVAAYDEVARISICEHPNWNPLYTLVGLLSCSVPIYLKADILCTLSALGKSKETATPLWNNLEASQIIKTLPGNVAYDTCNLEVEIEQNECRLEEYPLTQGILDLLYTLSTTVIPKNLGAGPRKLGLSPYLKFTINTVFLKFYNRIYKDVSEKWTVGYKCLKLFFYLLDVYEVHPNDFDEKQDCNPPPGFEILLNLNTKSEMLKLMLQIIDEARSRLIDLKKFKGKNMLEECALLCLKILKTALKLQDVFFEAHSVSNSEILLSGLSKLLFDINPSSGKPDNILNITYFITFFNWLPYHALNAIQVLHVVCGQAGVNSHIIGIFTQNEQTKNDVRYGFVECLEADFGYRDNRQNLYDNGMLTTESENNNVYINIKKAIITLVQDTLCLPTPNIGQFIMGLDYLKDLQYFTRNKLGGANEVGANCTKSVVLLLERHLKEKIANCKHQADIESLIEHSLRLLLLLCENSKTCDPILRYLRSRQDFLCRCVSELAILGTENINITNQISYLLKIIAIELKLSASNGQLSRFHLISSFFLGISSKGNQDTISLELSHFYTNQIHSIIDSTKNSTTGSHNNVLCDLINNVDMTLATISAPSWSFFEKPLIDQILKECEYKSTEGLQLIDLKQIHSILHNELKIVQSTVASGQKRLIIQEIESVLLYALKINEQKSRKASITKFVAAWSQVTEILFSCAHFSCLPVSKKQELIIEILQKIFLKTSPNQTLLEISSTFSETILILLVNLRICFNTVQDLDLEHMDGTDIDVQHYQTTKSNSLNIKFIFKNILEWVIMTGVASQKLRTNLYAALLKCLAIIREQTDKKETHINNRFITRLDKSIVKGGEFSSDLEQMRMFSEVLMSFGEKLMETICHDCIAGHDICKMSALACINILLDIDTMSHLLTFITQQGYLSHIIESISKSDNKLCASVANTSDSIKFIYIYESKMSMLLRFANTHVGAELILSNKVLDILSGMKVFDNHPDLKRSEVWQKHDIEDFVPGFEYRFRQILFPALVLCESLISTLGSENYSVIAQVTHFLFSHWDMFEIILRTGSPYCTLGLLEEIYMITSIISRTFNQEALMAISADTNGEISINLYKVKMIMLSIYSRFIISDVSFKEMFKPDNMLYEPTEENKALHVKFYLEIAANLTLFCRNIVTNNSVDHSTKVLLFAPHINETQICNEHLLSQTNSSSNLGVLVNQLKGCVEYYHAQRAFYEGMLRQRMAIDNISIDTTAKTKYIQLNKQLEEKQNVIYLCVFVTEQCLFLLWNQLDYYMRQSSVHKRSSTIHGDIWHNNGVKQDPDCTIEELKTLKKNLILIFNETFSKQLCSTIDQSESTESAFITALLRRIKTIIQYYPS